MCYVRGIRNGKSIYIFCIKKRNRRLVRVHQLKQNSVVVVVVVCFCWFMNIDIPHLLVIQSNSEGLGLSTRRAMTRLIRMGVPLKRQACQVVVVVLVRGIRNGK